MKRTHRKLHVVIWLVLLPVLLAFVYVAQQSAVDTLPDLGTAPEPSAVGVLP